jgi:hypothetical protein
VKSAAFSYFRRFYLKQNIIEFDPRKFLFSCIWLALKTEDQNMKMADFVKKCDYKNCTKLLLDLHESILLRGLNFHLYTYNPFESADILLQQLTEEEVITDLKTRTTVNITAAFTSPTLIFLFSHAHIALAALDLAREKLDLKMDLL